MQRQDLSHETVMPDGFVMRSPTLEDSAIIANLLNTQLEALVGRSGYSEESVPAFLNNPALNRERDARLIINEIGQAIAYLGIWNHPPYVESGLHICIHPDYEHHNFRQILLRWSNQVIQANVERAPQDAKVILNHWCFSNDEHALTYLKNAEFSYIRSSYRMGIDLDQNIPSAYFPNNIVIKRFSEVNDLRQLNRAIDEAFMIIGVMSTEMKKTISRIGSIGSLLTLVSI